jgi:uncharacterized protein YjbI with pentapeptide repeats
MANEEQLSILKQGVEVWNQWRLNHHRIDIDLREISLRQVDLRGVYLNLTNLSDADLSGANLGGAFLNQARLCGAQLMGARLPGANLWEADLGGADLTGADLSRTDLSQANLSHANLTEVDLIGSKLSMAQVGHTIFANLDLSEVMGLAGLLHTGPSRISIDVFARSKGKIPEVFLRGCGLSDADVEYTKLSNPDLSNEEINKILYRIYDLRASQAIQVLPLFISYSHGDGRFVDKLESYLNRKGIRFWRDIHDLKSGRMESQIDRAIRQNPTVLLVLSENSLSSDWVEHEVRTARGLEKEIGRDVLCPVALDDSWKSSHWPKRVMEQIMEYNILDFSAWKDDVKFESMFRKLIDGLELFYKG